MKKILIVDDEIRIGMLIKNLIHWDELGAECVNVFDDGLEAIEKIRECSPDIVITDIRMPQISGLDLIQTVQKFRPETYFIVISGYKEFEYAHKALEFGVESYLLKPINEEELNKVLKKITGEIVEQDLARKQVEESVAESKRIIKRDFLKTIIEQGEQRNTGSVDLKGDRYRGIDIKLDYHNYENRNQRQDEIMVEAVSQIVQECVQGHVAESLICEKENLHIYVLLNYHAGNTAQFLMLLNDCVLKIKERIMGLDQYVVTIGVGSEKGRFEDSRFTILECYQAVCNRLKYGTGRLIFFEDVIAGDPADLNQIVKDMQEDLLKGIETYSTDLVVSTVRRAVDSIERNRMDMMEYFMLAEMIVDLFLTHLGLEMAENSSVKRRIMGKIQHSNSVFALRKVLTTELSSCLDTVKESKETQSVRPIRVAMEYVEKNYASKLSLDEMAELVGLNPVYFSALFKKETGVNFSSYVTKIRMENAKKALVETQDTISAIGEQVGYENQKYFSQTFKKVVGIKPAVYRKMHT